MQLTHRTLIMVSSYQIPSPRKLVRYLDAYNAGSLKPFYRYFNCNFFVFEISFGIFGVFCDLFSSESYVIFSELLLPLDSLRCCLCAGLYDKDYLKKLGLDSKDVMENNNASGEEDIPKEDGKSSTLHYCLISIVSNTSSWSTIYSAP